MAILDSGSRTQFETGAVRDIRDDKGRCDLMPLDVVGSVLECFADETTLGMLEDFKADGDKGWLINALFSFRDESNYDSLEEMLLDVSHHYKEGCEKYGENNWQKGIPVYCYIDSAVRHYLKWCRGDEDERHDRAFVWNIMCAAWTCEHKPELNNYTKKEVTEDA